IRRGIALTQRSMISLDDLPDQLVASAGERVNDETVSSASATGFFAQREACVQRFEREYISNLLKQHKGNVKSAATEAEVPRGTLYRLMKSHGLDSDQFR
ncbi:MAG: hypothetical protein B7Z55_17835, partial [Planctomycetales bacterium 12-60-4]